MHSRGSRVIALLPRAVPNPKQRGPPPRSQGHAGRESHRGQVSKELPPTAAASVERDENGGGDGERGKQGGASRPVKAEAVEEAEGDAQGNVKISADEEEVVVGGGDKQEDQQRLEDRPSPSLASFLPGICCGLRFSDCLLQGGGAGRRRGGGGRGRGGRRTAAATAAGAKEGQDNQEGFDGYADLVERGRGARGSGWRGRQTMCV